MNCKRVVNVSKSNLYTFLSFWNEHFFEKDIIFCADQPLSKKAV